MLKMPPIWISTRMDTCGYGMSYPLIGPRAVVNGLKTVKMRW